MSEEEDRPPIARVYDNATGDERLAALNACAWALITEGDDDE